MLIAIEGLDGSGKTTQASALAARLNGLYIREPGGTPIGESIRGLLFGVDMEKETEVFLFMAARAELYRRVVIPALRAGKVVVSDRNWWSTYCYQGVTLERLLPMVRYATDGYDAGIVFYLDCPIGSLRLRPMADRDRIEQRGLGIVEENYRYLCSRFSHERIDATRGVSEITEELYARVSTLLRESGRGGIVNRHDGAD